ncbi:MAG: hypothetical protein ACRD0Z_01630 [Acidimicrobiales bacterium]
MRSKRRGAATAAVMVMRAGRGDPVLGGDAYVQLRRSHPSPLVLRLDSLAA